jgi:hypothetical protein
MPESFEWLQRRHLELEQRQSDDEQRRSDYLLSQVNDFIPKLQEAGADIRDAKRRTQLQNWLSHWQAFAFEQTGRMSQSELKQPPFNWWPIVLGAIILILLVAVAGFIRFVILVPSKPDVKIIALGGGAVVPGDALAMRSSAGVSTFSLESGISVSSPTGPGTVLVDDEPATILLDELHVARASDDRMIMLNDVSGLSVADTTDVTAIAIRAVAEDSKGIKSLEIEIDGVPVRFETDGLSAGGIIPAKAPVTHLTQDICIILQPWGSIQTTDQRPYVLAEESHTIKVIAWNNDGGRNESEGITLAYNNRSDDWRSWKAVTHIESCEAGLFSLSTSLPTTTVTPPPPFTPTPTPTRTSVTPTPTPTPVYPCTDNAAFEADVTVPDGTEFAPGAAFNKTWRLRNTGTCTWDTRYQLVYVGGARLSAPDAVNVPRVVPPDDTLDITVPMVAPNRMGTYRGYWQMRNPDCGNLFGITVHVHIFVRTSTGDLPVITRFEVVPSVINSGGQAILYWEYANGTTARLHPGDQAVGPSGSQVVSPGVTTSYLLIVSNAAGTVQRATTLEVESGPAPGPPPASPANLTVTAVGRDGFDLTWTDASYDEQGFRLYNASTGQAVATFSANVTNGTILGLNCGTPYSFYLVSFNERGDSWPSNTVQASTSACGG